MEDFSGVFSSRQKSMVEKSPMKVAIIGSRQRDSTEDKVSVFDLVNSLEIGDVVVSGGCRGIDIWAEQAAERRGLDTMIFKPILNDHDSYSSMVRAYHDRNKKIVDSSDLLYAFPAVKGLSGGTKNTVDYAIKRGKKVIFK